MPSDLKTGPFRWNFENFFVGERQCVEFLKPRNNPSCGNFFAKPMQPAQKTRNL
jgi:hypothetical protein